MKKFIALLLAVLNIVLFCGCSDNSASAIVYYGVITPPATLDPQLASTVTELTLVKNLYEGLMRKDASGNIVLGAAKTAEKNGNTYTFKISENAFWSDGTPVTAQDYLFGIKRALDPITNSPNATSLYIIKNAEAVHKGNLNADKLGVSAPDSSTLIIETISADAELYEALTLGVAMPCKRAFFEESKGKYGMSKDTMLSNGSFELTKWATEDFAMRIYRSSSYKGDFTAKISAVFLSLDKEQSNLQRLSKNKIDIAEIEISEIARAEQKGLKTITVPNTVWLMRIGGGYSPAMKQALLSSAVVYNEGVTDYPDGITPATMLYPAIFENNEKIGIYNIENAKATFKNEVAAFKGGELPEKTLYFEDKHGISEIMKKIAGHWQQNLGAYVNISGISNAKQVKAKESEYSITVYSEEITTPDYNKYAKFFGFNSANNLSANILKGNILPIAYSGTVLAYNQSLENLSADVAVNLIDFSNINKNQ